MPSWSIAATKDCVSLVIHGSQERFGLRFDRDFALSDEGRKRLTDFAFAVASEPDSGVPLSFVDAIGDTLEYIAMGATPQSKQCTDDSARA
jgi:hypothetical protein